MYSPLRDWIRRKYKANFCIKFLRFQWFLDEYVHDFQKQLDNFYAYIVRIFYLWSPRVLKIRYVIFYGWLHWKSNSIFFLCKKIMKGLRWALVHLLLLEGDVFVFCYQNCSDLLWEKIVLVIEKNFWNSRLKAENLQTFWDY